MISGGELEYIWPEFLARHAVLHRPEVDSHCIMVQAITLVRFADKGTYYITKLKAEKEIQFSWDIHREQQKMEEIEAMQNVIQALTRKVSICQMMVEVDGLLEDEYGDPIHQVDDSQLGEDERLKIKYLYVPQKT